MCGIIGILGKQPVTDRILDGLKRLEYRGYDSAGLAVAEDGRLVRRRAVGKLDNLKALVSDLPVEGPAGIGHTRWATHGQPTEANAHPHVKGRVAVVHNGIIENFKPLRRDLEAAGHSFEGETDTEVVACLIHTLVEELGDARAAVAEALKRVEGAFALAILIDGEEDLMIGARRGSPLAVGIGEGEMYLGSDAIALAPLTRRIVFLEDGDRVELTRTQMRLFDETGAEVKRPISQSAVTGAMIDKGNYRHFMQKEIYEQPTVVGQTLGRYLDPLAGRVVLPEDLPFDLAQIPRLTMVACGTAFYAASVARYWFEQIARLPVTVDIASEFRYREPILERGGAALFVSQSGETADTLAALQHCKAQGQHLVGVVNVPESSIAREADVVLPTFAGPEIGVASTKAFTCQLAVLAALAVYAGRVRGHLDQAGEQELVQALTEVPSRMADVLAHDEAIEDLSRRVISRARDVLYLGRGADYPIALEGALKLKEISYIHAEGYAAGEMKHGPIALIDENVPIIMIAPRGPLYDKTISNMQEVIARKGQVVLMTCGDGCADYRDQTVATIQMPAVHQIAAPMLYSIPVQLLAYHTAVAKGTDVDQPRNLAKSVTVE